MIDAESYRPFFERLAQTPLAEWCGPLHQAITMRLDRSTHGDLDQWHAAISGLPQFQAKKIRLNQAIVKATGNLPENQQTARTRELLQQLHPWRKGPFNLNGISIDTEWRSDWKWERLENHIQDLSGKLVLDVGCGNGYHCWRMAGAGARLVVGIDPSLLFLMQFFTCRHFLADDRVWVLPLAIEDLPPAIAGFDSIFSMGVLYHRRTPVDHLLELQSLLGPDGELVLETLVIDGGENSVLVPQGRYARMRNVWFIPSVAMLQCWLKRCKFRDIKLIDVSTTSPEEQRSTDWMRFESLQACLDPADSSRTIEGHPAPLRAIITARR